MADRTSISLDHQQVQALALALFDGAAAAHRLPAKARPLLALAAAYYTHIAPEHQPHAGRAGRDMVLAAPIPDLPPDDQAIVAGVLALQREKPRPRREPLFWRLGQRDRATTVALAAILGMAVALRDLPPADVAVQVRDGATALAIGGPHVLDAIAAANGCAKRWIAAIGPIAIRSAGADELSVAGADGAAEPAPPDVAALPAWATGALGEAPVAEAGRRMLRQFFDKLLALEDAVRKGEDVEDVHQMRVATRRLRAALQVVEELYEPKLIRQYRRGLQRVAQALGAVRDGDVFLEHVVAYRDALLEEQRAGMDRLIAAVEAERARGRRELLDDLASKRYAKFKRAFAAFLTTPGAGALPAPEPGVILHARDFAGSAIWRRYELWRAYARVLRGADDETLHQARIAGKRLRYTLEFFADTLGPNVRLLLAPLGLLQETLGELQDGVTAREHVARLGLADDPGAQAYLAARAAERETHLAQLPQRWSQVDGAAYRRQLIELIASL